MRGAAAIILQVAIARPARPLDVDRRNCRLLVDT